MSISAYLTIKYFLSTEEKIDLAIEKLEEMKKNHNTGTIEIYTDNLINNLVFSKDKFLNPLIEEYGNVSWINDESLDYFEISYDVILNLLNTKDLNKEDKELLEMMKKFCEENELFWFTATCY